MSFKVAMEGEVASFSNWEMKPLVRSARLASSSWVRELAILSRFSLSPIFKKTPEFSNSKHLVFSQSSKSGKIVNEKFSNGILSVYGLTFFHINERVGCCHFSHLAGYAGVSPAGCRQFRWAKIMFTQEARHAAQRNRVPLF
jgi:hypothetical protein